MSNLIQTYRQAAWRIQRQWIGLFLLAVVLTAMVASVYLNVTARTALTGREIQLLQSKIAENQRINADLETQLARLLSTSEMTRRAAAMGFLPVRPEDVTYVVVPGYSPPPPISLAAPPQPASSALPPEFTQSLFEWLDQQIRAAGPLEAP